jgi:hypothetical protein
VNGRLTTLDPADVESAGPEVHIVPTQADKLAGSKGVTVGHEDRGRIVVSVTIVPSGGAACCSGAFIACGSVCARREAIPTQSVKLGAGRRSTGRAARPARVAA